MIKSVKEGEIRNEESVEETAGGLFFVYTYSCSGDDGFMRREI